MRYFLAVAQHRHFTRAAEQLGIAQPALSQQIRQLERELGVRLFDRDNRRVSVTAAGQAFLAHAEKAVDAADTALAEMEGFAGSLKGRVVIGSIQSLSELKLPAILARFHAEHPHVEIVLREDASDAILSALLDGALDIALLNTARREMPAGIVFQDIHHEDLVAVVAPAHPLAAHERVALAELREEPFILFKFGTGVRRVVEQGCNEAGFTPRVTFESGDWMTISALATEGLGVAILPRGIADLAGSRVRAIPLLPPLRCTHGIAWRSGRHLSGAANAMLGFLRQALQQG